MADKVKTLEIKNVLLADAAELVAARAKGLIIHHGGDIDAAGDEVEKAVRRVVSRKLPTNYYVGHGHVVDSQLTQSPQLDVIIADNRSAPVLFQTENGTEYFPYESVYAFGEIKSGYYKDKNYIHGFSRTIRDIRDNLQREDTPPTYLGMGLSVQHPDMLEGIDKPYRNPLFSFMIFVAANNFKIEDVTDLYASTLNRYLPNVICFLDSGLMINTTTSRTDAGSLLLEQLNIHPEFNKPSIDRSDNWALIRFDSDAGYQTGANLAYLYYMLIGHLQSCVLMQPDLFRYLENLFGPFTANIIKLKT